MRQAAGNVHSIRFQFLKLLVLSAMVSGLFLCTIHYISCYIIDHYYFDSDYADKRDIHHVQKLQQYIDQNQLSSKDISLLETWVRKQGIIAIAIYNDEHIIFNPEYHKKERIPDNFDSFNINDWLDDYPINFIDKKAQVFIIDLYEYRLYTISMICELFLSFALFFWIVVQGIQKKITYISKLCSEIKILEGGSLDCPITVIGNDELAALASGLNSLRLSFQDTIETEATVAKEHQRIIAEMSHDIRTPITSILLYAEIANSYSNKYQDPSLNECIKKINKTAERLRTLSEHLIEYSFVSKTDHLTKETASFTALFYDLLGETNHYLQQQGFDTIVHISWTDSNISIYSEYIMRILDNITSNIIKYAEPQKPVLISSFGDESKIGFSFKNSIRLNSVASSTRKLGIQSIKRMMQKMDGDCCVRQSDSDFCIEIWFPVL